MSGIEIDRVHSSSDASWDGWVIACYLVVAVVMFSGFYRISVSTSATSASSETYLASVQIPNF